MINSRTRDGRLKKAVAAYLAAGFVFVAIVVSVVLCGAYKEALDSTVTTLQKARINLMKVRETGGIVDSSLSEVKAVLPRRAASGEPEDLLFAALDDLKDTVKHAEISVENMERKSDEVTLPVRIKSDIRDYTDFINTIGYLQSLQFPFFSISNIELAQAREKDRGVVSYEIKGILRMPGKI